jgi:uncharacterized phage protein (predicted DNA packaging)
MTLTEVKEFIKVEHNDEDVLISTFMNTADALIKTHIGSLDLNLGAMDTLPVKQAKLMLISYFYENRDDTKGGIPEVVYELLRPYRKVAF